ncbi:MAG: HDIG domain-containing protein [Planctomycetes bacterium]|nr:HDIG domain-containing protein [Planctomycetota bacterium]
MALFDRQRQRARRVDPRKLKGDGLRGLLSSLSEPRNMMRLAILLLLVAGTLVLMLTPYEPLQYRKDQSTDVSIVSRVSFEFVDEAATNKKREEARNTTPRVYSRDTTALNKVREEFIDLLGFASEQARPPKPPPTDSDQTTPTPPPPATDNATGGTPPAEPAAAAPGTAEAPVPDPLAAEKAERKKRFEALKKSWSLDDIFGQVVELAKDDKARERLVKCCETAVAYIQSLPILSDPDHFYESVHTELSHIYIFDNGELIKQDKAKNPPLNIRYGDTRDLVEEKVTETFASANLSLALRERIRDRFAAALAPTLTYDDARTKAQQDEAVSNVKPVMREFRRKDVLVARDSKIGDEELKILAKEHEAYLAQLSLGQRAGAVVGSLMLAVLLVSLLTAFTAIYQPNVVVRPIRGLIVVVLILSVLVVAKFVRNWPPLALFQLVTVAMILTIAYSRRFALVLAWWTAALAALVTRLDFNTLLLMVIGSSIAVLQLKAVRSRLKLTYVGLLTGAVLMLTIWATKLWDREMSDAVGPVLGYGLLAMAYGLLAGIFVLGILPFIERVFGVVTHISLLEFCDANQPALKKLAIEAPGTYSHSLLLGSIVEPAAEAIGANGLLARVGAYFHDIGKVNKPHYFTENRNQLGDLPDHDKLTPQMSKLIITSHIKDGLDMAEQYGLPRVINAFIAEHHGTTVIEYFYYEALKTSDGPIDETEFRYPGPRPQSKETAILMLADSCEGAVRSIKEPTPPKIEDRVHQIVMKRLLDGQLDESGLSLNEVRTIEQSLTKSLISVHHGRIAYPNERQQQEAAAANAQRNHSGEGAGGAAPRTDSSEGHS